MKKILEKTPMNDQFSSFYSEKTQERDHFYEEFFIGLTIVPERCLTIKQSHLRSLTKIKC